MPNNDNNLEYNDNLPYSDENVGDIDDFENELGDVPDLSNKQKEQFKNRYGKDSFIKRAKKKIKQTWNGNNKVGQYLGLGLDVGESFLPNVVGRIRDIIQNKTQSHMSITDKLSKVRNWISWNDKDGNFSLKELGLSLLKIAVVAGAVYGLQALGVWEAVSNLL